jgi:hypothetical protein
MSYGLVVEVELFIKIALSQNTDGAVMVLHAWTY